MRVSELFNVIANKVTLEIMDNNKLTEDSCLVEKLSHKGLKYEDYGDIEDRYRDIEIIDIYPHMGVMVVYCSGFEEDPQNEL